MASKGTRGAYRKEDRVALPKELQAELVRKAAAKVGNCQELAKKLNIPKSSVHYYLVGRLTMPLSLLEAMLLLAEDEALRTRIESLGVAKDRLWSIWNAKSVFIESCKGRVYLPTIENLKQNDDLRRKTASIISYLLAEGSLWTLKEKWGELAANITFASHERDLHSHFRALCRDVFRYDIGPPREPGNEAKAIRGFIYSRYVAEQLLRLGVPLGDKASAGTGLPDWVMNSSDENTWIAALQPVCDGEGCVNIDFRRGMTGFTVSQSRHTDLDLWTLPRGRRDEGNARYLNLEQLEGRSVFGVPVLDYLRLSARSHLIDDSSTLFKRLGLSPRIRIQSLYLKDNGFWSCIWIVRLPRNDAVRILDKNLVTQELKRFGLQLFAD